MRPYTPQFICSGLGQTGQPRRTAPGAFQPNITEAEEDQVTEEILFDPV